MSVSEMEKESDMDRWWVPLSKDKAEANTDCEEESVINNHLADRMACRAARQWMISVVSAGIGRREHLADDIGTNHDCDALRLSRVMAHTVAHPHWHMRKRLSHRPLAFKVDEGN